jgi:ubiquinone/menaquinone biosynthesis C-methylase UbiE
MESAGSGGAAVDRFYTRWAGLYDLFASAAPGIKRARRRGVDALGAAPGDAVVEMGCGTGANLPHLRESVGSAGRVVGVDLAGGALARARLRIERAGWGNVDVVRGDAIRPPLAQVDTLLATFVVGMFDDPAAVVGHWCDVVEPPGRIVLLNATRSDHPAAGPLNLAFRGFVRLGAPEKRLARGSPTEDLERSIERAQEALRVRCGSFRRESLLGGYLTLATGEVRE